MGLSTKKFSGSMVALVTPMTTAGEIDLQSLYNLIDWHIASGTDAIVIMGTTGESSLVSTEEHVEVVKLAIEHAQKRLPIIAGCGSASTAKVVELVKKLNPFAPDAYLCVTPYYVKPSQQGLIEHFNVVADACKAPLLLYNVPSRTACDLTNESVVELSRHHRIIGIKDAVGDVDRAVELFKKLGDSFIYLSGDDASAFKFVLEGGDGVISVTANIAPNAMSHWCQALLKRDLSSDEFDQAQTIFDQLMPLHQTLFIEANPIAVKWALHKMQKIPAGIRLPLTQPSQQSQLEIADVIRDFV